MATADEECIHGLAPATCAICKAPAPRSADPRTHTHASLGRKTPDNSHDYFGHSWPEWFQMCDAGAAFILESARQGRFVTYGGLWSQVEFRLGRSLGNRWRQQRNLLRDISDRTFEQTGALISALVVEDGASQEPQRGFFRLAADRGMLAEDDAPVEGEVWTGMTPRQREFWKSQLRKLGFPDVDG